MILLDSNIMVFIIATVSLNLLPGSDVIYIANQSLQGRKQGILAALGVSIGAGIYVAATVAGLIQAISKTPAIFNTIQLAGAIYLIYLGITIYNTPLIKAQSSKINKRSALNIIGKGTLNTLLNPKVGIFLISFLPQFIQTRNGDEAKQLALLGIFFVTSGTLINITYSILISHVKGFSLSKNNSKINIYKISAMLLVLMGVKIITGMLQ